MTTSRQCSSEACANHSKSQNEYMATSDRGWTGIEGWMVSGERHRSQNKSTYFAHGVDSHQRQRYVFFFDWFLRATQFSKAQHPFHNIVVIHQCSIERRSAAVPSASFLSKGLKHRRFQRLYIFAANTVVQQAPATKSTLCHGVGCNLRTLPAVARRIRSWLAPVSLVGSVARIDVCASLEGQQEVGSHTPTKVQK